MLYIITFTILLVLFCIDRKKTIKSIKVGIKKMLIQLPVFFTMSGLVAISLYFIDDNMIAEYLGKESNFLGVLNAGFIGSISIMPGFIAFPLAGILLEKGVPYMVLAAFTNTLMMVGVVSFPIEKEYFGVKVALIRNVIGLLMAVFIAFLIGLFYGEVF